MAPEGNRLPVVQIETSAMIQPNHRVDVGSSVDPVLEPVDKGRKCHHASMAHKVPFLVHRKQWGLNIGMEVAGTLVGLGRNTVVLCCIAAEASDLVRSP